jgi:hypothetical protein
MQVELLICEEERWIGEGGKLESNLMKIRDILQSDSKPDTTYTRSEISVTWNLFRKNTHDMKLCRFKIRIF